MRSRGKNSLTKQLLIFSCGIILSLLAAFCITDSYIKSRSKENVLKLNEKILLQIQGNVKDYYDMMNHIATALAYSPTTKEYFRQNSLERVIAAEKLDILFNNIMMLEDDIEGIYLYDKNMERIAAMGKETGESCPVTELKTGVEYSNLFSMDGTGRYYYLIYSPIYDLDSRQFGGQIGMSVLVMKTDSLKEYLLEMEQTPNEKLYLLDRSNTIIASSDNMDEGSILQEEKNDSVVETCDTAIRGWQVYSRIPKRELYVSRNGGMTFVAVAYGFACLLIGVFIYFCYKNFILRIYKIDQFINHVMADSELRMEETLDDEIGRVIHSLNQMLDEKESLNQRMQDSQKRMYEIELDRKQLEVLAYKNQINPHFLYNTFECIRGMALYHDMEDIAEITMALSKVFRFAVKGDNIVTVQDEINYIKEYATIIEYRFMGRIEVVVDVEEELYKKQAPKLILQPLVENAVFHGLEQKMNGGEVRVAVHKKWDSFMMFLVEDNGCGMEKERVEQVLANLDSKENKSIGLANIYQRLKLFYGNDMVFEIKSCPGEGTKVMIVVPDHVEEKQTYE